jgi:hypothetical protein
MFVGTYPTYRTQRSAPGECLGPKLRKGLEEPFVEVLLRALLTILDNQLANVRTAVTGGWGRQRPLKMGRFGPRGRGRSG